MGNANIHGIKVESQTKIEETVEIREIYRCIPNWPMSMEERDVFGGNDFHGE